ncbi:MAG: biotin--[acetyl-CoA-carboxylase] ligase [Bacteroidales bacterium]
MEIYKNIYYYNELSSTNTCAYALMQHKKTPEYTVIVSENQTHGKGQKNAVWESNPGENLTFSIIVYPDHISANKQFVISECISLAIRNVVAHYCAEVFIKWPNDIYVGDKKIAGILLEHILSGYTIAGSVIGVGLNCNQTTFSESIPNPVSVKQCIAHTVSVKELLYEVLEEFYVVYSHTKTDPLGVHATYLQHIYLFNTFSTYKDKDGVFLGKIIDIEQNGVLHIQDEHNQKRTYFFKEVELVHSKV